MEVIEKYTIPSAAGRCNPVHLLTLSFRLDPRMAQKGALPLLLLLTLFACARARVTREAWAQMNAADKQLYVLTLIGREKAKEQKGGNDRVFALPAEEYVKRIDEAYARGDVRDVDAVFGEMGTRR